MNNSMPIKWQLGRFLEKFNLPRLNQEEIKIMSNPITSTEIETDQNLPRGSFSLLWDVFLSMFPKKQLRPIAINPEMLNKVLVWLGMASGTLRTFWDRKRSLWAENHAGLCLALLFPLTEQQESFRENRLES